MEMKVLKKMVLLALGASSVALVGCGGSDSDSNSPPATSSAVGSTIKAMGGLGGNDGGIGGDGDYFNISTYGPGDIELLRSGSASTAGYTTSPIVPTTYLGDAPLEVMTDLTIDVVAVEPAAGTYYMIDDDFRIYLSDGDTILGNIDSDETVVTGISVASGATLTLGLNSSGNTGARIDLLNDIHNKGTVTTTDASATARGNLSLYPASFVNQGSIALAGTLDGQSGGYFDLWSDYSTYNHGAIDTSGADSTTGTAGEAGTVDLGASINVQNTAMITAEGDNYWKE